LAGQLTAADYTSQADESYAYDANGNRTSGGATIGPNTQVLSDGTYDYDYDDEGNLSRKSEIATGEYTEYAYDHRNRLTSATTYSSGGIILEEVEFTYDVFDRRIAKTVDADGAGPQTAVTTYTVYDGEHAWADFDESGAVTSRYLFGDRMDEIIARWTPSDGTANKLNTASRRSFRSTLDCLDMLRLLLVLGPSAPIYQRSLSHRDSQEP
jgi:YD repeat-containing protein